MVVYKLTQDENFVIRINEDGSENVIQDIPRNRDWIEYKNWLEREDEEGNLINEVLPADIDIEEIIVPNYNEFWIAFKESSTYNDLRNLGKVDIAINAIATELLVLFSTARYLIPEPEAIQVAISELIPFLTEEQLTEIMILLTQYNLDQVITLGE